MKDILYYYNKVSFREYELGEIQAGFNMSFVVDGTKDSCKVIVVSYIKQKITPNTICYHKATDTWWIVAHDKTSRYENENGYYYTHELSLEGAIELLNSRDLTDSGFNQNRYTVGEFINRLFDLSNFEFNKTEWNTDNVNNRNLTIEPNNNISLDKVVDYLKTFENYTLLSALREFLDGYNCVAKLSFIRETNLTYNEITGAIISIISKTGNYDSEIKDIDEVFNDVREIVNTNKNNYGTSVISNAENVVSTKTKTYPSVGGVKLSSKTNTIDGTNAIIRLPSNIFKVNYIDMFSTKARITLSYGGMNNSTYYDSSDISSCETAYNYIKNDIETNHPNDLQDFITNVSPSSLQKINRRFYYCDNYDPVNHTFISNYKINEVSVDLLHLNTPVVLTNKELSQTLQKEESIGICYERGKDFIENFIMFTYSSNTECKITNITEDTIFEGTPDGYDQVVVKLGVGNFGDLDNWKINETSFSVNYIPMGDVKIKMDNDGDTIDSNLYNQNGRLNDSNSLSKVLLSYSKEIESDTITKYGVYYGEYVKSINYYKDNFPKVGDIVKVDSDYYVVNNLSIDLAPNENTTYGYDDSIIYHITAEVSLSKKVATKSLLTSPNTNIRDYGIPQNNNVKRKQLYRDFYEFGYEPLSYTNDWYLPLGKILNLDNNVSNYQEHIAIINTTFADEMNGSTDYYYQLETTTYLLKKSIYEIVDFKDNNIIGYGFQNIWSGFDITKLFVSGNYGNFNTPISYVDNNGELVSLKLKMTTIEYVQESYDNYSTYDESKVYNSGDKITKDKIVWTCNTNGTTGTWDSSKWTNTNDYSDISLYNASVFIPSQIYTYLTNSKYDYMIEETKYKKDALEVPVFEYSCQIDDSEQVIVGENILDRGNDDAAYLYSYALVPTNLYDDNNYLNISSLISSININSQNQAIHSYAVQFDYSNINNTVNPSFSITLFDNETIDIDDNTKTFGTQINLSELDLENKSLVIIRHNITQDDLFTNIVGELSIDYTTPQASLPTASKSLKNKCVVLNDGTYAICQPDQYTLTLTINANCRVRFRLMRDGVYVFDDVYTQTTTFTVYEDDLFWWDAYAEEGYYIDGSTTSGVPPIIIHGSDYSKTFTALQYRTISLTNSVGIREITINIGGTQTTYSYSPMESITKVISNIKQNVSYSIVSASVYNGYKTATITGGSNNDGSGNTTAGDANISVSTVYIIQPIVSITLGGILRPISSGWTNTLTAYPNFEFASEIDKSTIQNIKIKMTVYQSIGGGAIANVLTKTYLGSDLTALSATKIYDYYNEHNPITIWDNNVELTTANGVSVSSVSASSTRGCKIEATVNYTNGTSITTSIGGSTSILTRTYNTFYFAHFDGESTLKYRVFPVGQDSFDSDNSIGRWYPLEE